MQGAQIAGICSGLKARVPSHFRLTLKTDVTWATAVHAVPGEAPGRLGRRVGPTPRRRPGLWRPALSPLRSYQSPLPESLPAAASARSFSSPSPASGSAFPPSTLDRIQSEGSFELLFSGGDVGAGGIALQLSFPEMFEGTSRVFIPIQAGDGFGFQALSSSCHQTNEALRALERRTACYS